MVWLLRSFALLSALLLTVASAHSYTYEGPGIFETGRLIPAANKYFLQVLAGESRQAAHVRYECIRKTQPSLPAAIYRLPNNDTIGVPQPYGVVLGSYLSKAEADRALVDVRKHFDYAAVLSCLGVSANQLTDAVPLAKLQSTIRELNEKPVGWYQAEEKTPVAYFDKIGPRRIAQDDQSRVALVEAVRYRTAEAASAALAHYRSLAPEIHFVIIRHGRSYLLSVTDLLVCDAKTNNARACRDMVAPHIREMRRHGMYAIQTLAIFSAGDSGLLTDTTVRLVGANGKDLPWDRPTDTTGAPMVTQVVEEADLFEPVQARVTRCYTGKLARLDELASCSGVILSPLALTTCLMDGLCQGERVPIGYLQDPQTLLKTCLGIVAPGVATTGILDIQMACQGTTLEPALLAILDKTGIRSCWREGGQVECAKAKETLSEICAANAPTLQVCQSRPDAIQVMQARVDKMLACLNDAGKCSAIAVQTASAKARLVEEAQRIGLKVDQVLAPVVTGLGGLAGSTQDVVNRFKACRDLKVSNSPAAHECFVGIGMSPTSLAALNCLKTAGNDDDARLKCVVPDGTPQAKALDMAKCAAGADQDLDKLSSCAGGDAAKLKKSYECVDRQATMMDAALNCMEGVNSDFVVAVKCAKATQGASGYLGCLPNIGEREKAALCLARATTDSQKMECLAGQIPLDPKAMATVTCLTKSNGNGQAMAACAVVNFLPPEVAKAAACASQSTGAVSFALCATGSGMNAEMRMAAECAASTGGEPVTFAGCTAGRLTVAELTKCLSGEIGTDGGCFGPNNTIVKTINNIAKDLTEGLGPGNELVKAFGPVTEALKDVGGKVSEGLQHLGNQAKRGDVGRTICNWFGC